MTSTPIEVADWMSAKTFSRPRMTATIGLPVADALGLVVSALTAHGYDIPSTLLGTSGDASGVEDVEGADADVEEEHGLEQDHDA